MQHNFEVRNTPSSKGLLRFAPIYLFVFGLLWLGAGVGLYIYTNSFIQKAAKAEGTVTELIRVKNDKGGATYAPVIIFHDQTNREIEFTTNSSSNPPSYSVGEQVNILYDPTRPEQAQINSFMELWGGALFFGGLGFIIAMSGIIAFFIMRSRKNKLTETHRQDIKKTTVIQRL